VRAGFRLSLAGSGAAMGVEPDLTCYCKALGNGYPISAALGRERLRDAATAVFFTGSYWTGPVEMAAALACLAELEATDAITRMRRAGTRLRDAWWPRASRTASRSTGRAAGAPVHDLPRRRRQLRAEPRLRRREHGARRVPPPHHNWFVSAALRDADVDRILDTTDAAFAEVARSPVHQG